MHIGSLGLPELLVILLIIVVIFGARRLPELGKSLGEGIRNFRKSFGGKDTENKELPPDKNQPPNKKE